MKHLSKALLFFFGMTTVSNGFAYGALRIQHLVGLLVSPCVALSLWKEKRKLLSSFFNAFPLIFLSWYTLSLLWVEDLQGGFRYCFYVLNGFFVIAATQFYLRDVSKVERFFKVIALFCLVELIFALGETIFGFHWVISRFSEHLELFNINPSYKLYLEQINKLREVSEERYQRAMTMPFGFHWGPNRFGLFLTIILPYFIFVLRRKLLKAGSILLITYLIFSGSSRAIYLAFNLILLSSLVLFRKKLERPIRLLLLTLFIVSNTLVISPLHQYSPSLVRFASTFSSVMSYFGYEITIPQGKDDSELDMKEINAIVYRDTQNGLVTDSSMGKRSVMRQFSYGKFKESPLRGLGAGNSAVESGMLFGKSKIHNFWLEILFEGGALFALLFLYWVFLLSKKLFKLSLLHQDPIIQNGAAASIVVGISLTLSALAIGSPVYLQALWLYIGLSYTLVLNFDNSKEISHQE